MRFVIGILAAAIFPGPAFASQHTWTDTQVCRAAVASYFFLQHIPVYVGERKGAHTIADGGDHFYTCRARNGEARLSWKEAGEFVQSKPILYVIQEYKLIVTTELGLRAFQIDGQDIHSSPDI